MANGPRKELSFLDRALMDKAATQGGVLNFLGQQPQVTAPIKAQSHADSPPVELAYITDAEKDLLVKANIHGSMAGKPNPGPAGIASLDDFFTTTDDKGNVQIGGGGGEQVFSYEQGDTQGAGGYTPQTGVGSGQGVTDEGKIVESKKPTLPEEKKKEEKKEETVFQKIQDIFTGDEINNFTPLMLNKVQEQLNQFQKLGVKNPLTLRSLLFGNIGGTADQNIERWINQFKKDDSLNQENIIVERDSLDNKYITLLEMYGNYEVPNMGNPSQEKTLRNNYGLLGGVIEFPNSLYFVKAVGLNSAISSNKDNFKKFVYSIRLN